MINENSQYNLWFASIEGMSYTRAKSILKFFENPKEVYLSTDSLLRATGLDFSEKIIKAKNTSPSYYVNLLKEKNIRFTSIWDNDYPTQLKNIYNPPVGLYSIGKLSFSDLKNQDYPNISVVGSRQCSDYGILTTLKIARFLASKNIIVISGMALGIDTYAHKGVLEEKGITIAVLGCGVDICYPKGNFYLYEKIKETGVILSEYVPGSAPKTFHFPMRNRIISGLSQATVVVEAGIKSGSLITADCALEQGKDVFSVPGNITSTLSSGTNNLIKQGAYILTDPNEILETLNILYTKKPIIKEEKPNTNIDDLTPEEKTIISCLTESPIEIDEIHRKTLLDMQILNYNLTMLELKGILKRLPGNKYAIDF